MVKSTISSVFSTLTNIMTAPFKAAQSVISGILGGITSSINKVTSAISSIGGKAKTVDYSIDYKNDDLSVARFNNNQLEVGLKMVKSYVTTSNDSISDMIDKFSVNARSLSSSSKENLNVGKASSNVVINNTYNSPKPVSIRELKRQDEIQMRRLAMQLNF